MTPVWSRGYQVHWKSLLVLGHSGEVPSNSEGNLPPISFPPQRCGHQDSVLNRNDVLFGGTKHSLALCPGCRYKYTIYRTVTLKQFNPIKLVIPWIWSWSLRRVQWWRVTRTKEEPPNQPRMSPATKQLCRTCCALSSLGTFSMSHLQPSSSLK